MLIQKFIVITRGKTFFKRVSLNNKHKNFYMGITALRERFLRMHNFFKNVSVSELLRLTANGCIAKLYYTDFYKNLTIFS